MKVVRLPQTYTDLVEIAVYLGQDDPAVADRFYDAYEQTLAAIKRTPKIGSIRDTIYHGRIKMWLVKNFEKGWRLFRGPERPSARDHHTALWKQPNENARPRRTIELPTVRPRR